MIMGRAFGVYGGLDMDRWIFEPGHSAAGFAVRHMMVSLMRGQFKHVHGSIDFNPASPMAAAAPGGHES
jgi:polyisoprenoid-binding protein YceI